MQEAFRLSARPGEALPCPQAKTAQRLNLGNMRRDGVVRVWNNDAYREFRERLWSANPPAPCRQCSVHHAGHEPCV